jgi:DNA-binding Lrp family transcriptional regulator
MNETDKRLLDIIQDDFPLIREPFDKIASLLRISPDDVIARLRRLKNDDMIRRIGAIFNSKKLGYCSTLCAMKVDQSYVDEVARIINKYIGVTHNYIRDHDYNMWFTITAKSQQALERIIEEIKERSGIDELIELPAIRMFKIRVRFPMTDAVSHKINRKTGYENQEINLTEIDRDIIREIQEDVPLIRWPFDAIADKVGIEVAEFLTRIQWMRDQDIMRRFGAIVRHRNLGFTANGMGVWIVPEDKAEETGMRMAAFPQVSHCYQRPVKPGWSYNLFTMIHGKSKEKCEEIAKLISADTGIDDYRILYSTRELKKVSMKYFTEGE